MVNAPGSNVQPLLSCLEDGSSPPEDKTDVYLRLAEGLAIEDKLFVEEICNVSSRLMSVLTRDMSSQRIDLSQAALQAVGYCIYQDRIVSSLGEIDMSLVLQDLCNVVMTSTDKNLCTRALWGIAKQHLSMKVVTDKLPVLLNTVEHALQTFDSTTVENEAMEVIYRLVSELPSENITSTAGRWAKLVYPLLISSAHKIREKALGILELGIKQILLAQKDIVAQLFTDLKGGLLSELAKLFSDKKEIYVLRTWAVLVTILGETLHKGGNFINEMLKIPEQGFRSALPNVQNMSYTAWISLIDNFAISQAYIGSSKKIKLLMMPLLLKSGSIVHEDIENGRLEAWWHLVCVLKPEIYSSTTAFSEVCLPLLQYFFDVSTDSTSLGNTKDGLRELALPVTPVFRGQANTPSSSRSGKSSKRKSLVFNKSSFPEAFVNQIMLLGCDMLVEILETSPKITRKSKRLTEHLQSSIMNTVLFQDHLLFFMAIVKSSLSSYASKMDDDLAVSIWNNIVNWIIPTIQNGDPKNVDDIIASLFLCAYDILRGQELSPNLVLKFLEILTKVPTKYLFHQVTLLQCQQGKPIFLLTDILFTQLPTFKETYVDERFHIVFEHLVDVCLEAPSAKLTTIYNVWLILEGLTSTVTNVEDLWRFWSKVTDSVAECVTKTSDVNQGDSLEPDFSLMLSLLRFPFKQLFTGGLPLVTMKELDRDLSEFFKLFLRCASLVPAAEANACIEELSKSLLTIATQENCSKNVRFLESLSGFLCVMMESFDFSAETTRTSPLKSHVTFTPKGKSRQSQTPLGNLRSLVALSAKILTISFRLVQDSSGSVPIASAVTAVTGSLSKLFTGLTNPEQIKFSIAALSSSISSFISHHNWSSSVVDVRSRDKKCHSTKYLLKIEKLWTDILTCLQNNYKASFDSQLLKIMSELLECTLSHQRRQFKNQTIVFWNATFGKSVHLEYPDSLRVVLQSVMEKTNLIVPDWDQSMTDAVASLDHSLAIKESEEMTPKENIIRQDLVMANSPKRKHSGSSPGKLKGSFMHKTVNDKNDRLSPFKNYMEVGNKRKSPGSANARRKLPLPLDTADDKDFVVIAPSPKKKRLLTEHQKEVRKAKKMESGHPALYNMLDQSQDGMQFSDWSQSSMTQSFINHDMEITDKKNASRGDSKNQVGGETNEIIQRTISFVSDSNGLDVVSKPTVLADEVNLLENDKNVESLLNNTITLPGEALSCSNYFADSKTSSCDLVDSAGLDKNINNDDDDELIPSSQNTPSSSSRPKRRSRIYHTLKNTQDRSFSPEKSKTVELKNRDADKMTTEKESLMETYLTSSSREKKNNESSDIIMSVVNDMSSEAALKQKSLKVSPISSRTRYRKNVTPYRPKKNDKNSKNLDALKETFDVKKSDILSDMEEFSDHQMDDTQLIEEPAVVVTHTINDDDKKELEKKLDEAPSSPVASSSIKFVNSKTSATGSPLNRPHRSFSSPACSPTTGILKRNRGKSETPSPPGKNRHVSFAFPLKEEKEISFYPLDKAVKHTRNESTKRSEELTSSFTSIKETKSSTPPISKEECVFPDLVECTTPVEQILPSLASRFSRGLGHVVHAQNIRTVGNLSALTKDQVEKLPIRSPKVSTLRRVLRSFHENRNPKNQKVNQLQAIKEVCENAEVEDSIVDGLSDKDTADKSLCLNNTPDRSETDPVIKTPSNSSTESGKMITPKRCRALVKPTTLFDSDAEENRTDALTISEVTDKENITKENESEEKLLELCEEQQNIKQTNLYFTEKTKEYVTQSGVNRTKIEEESSCKATAGSIPKISDNQPPSVNYQPCVLNKPVDSDVINGHPAVEQCVKMDFEETGLEVIHIAETEESKQENRETRKPEIDEMSVYDEPEPAEDKIKDQEAPTDDMSITEKSKQEHQEIVISDAMPVEYSPTLENSKIEHQEIFLRDVPMTAGEEKAGSEKKIVDDVLKTDTLKQDDCNVSVEETFSTENTIDPYLKTLNGLLKSQEELTELPLDVLFSCHRTLMTILSNTTTAIQLKCETSRK